MLKPTATIKGFLYSFHSIGLLITSFLPILFFEKGLTETQIGLVLSLGTIAALISQPLSGYLSDIWKTNKRVILILLAGLITSSFFLFQMHSYFLILSFYFLVVFFMSPIGALSDSLSQKTADKLSVSFGSIRSWGSVGFAVTALLAGQWFAKFGIGQLQWMILFFSAFAILFGLFLKDVKVSERKVSNKDFLNLFKDRRFVAFLFVIVAVTLAHRTNDSYISLHLKHLGADESIVGWAWFIGVMTEVLVLALSYKWFRRYHELTFIALAAWLYIIRFFLIGLIRDPNIILLVQPLHGLCFGIFFPAALQYVTKIVKPEVQSTAHVLLITVFFGVCGIIGGLMGGHVMESYGGSALYFLLSGCSVVGFISVLTFSYAFASRN
ncbi:MFS transporter [Ammoniphilus sp. YIM 78166]|uniref:MFS transporter n=1 Tax=Ammoniphilus sp. YIM 78166 TaxID=1644106 RepID=UPI0010701E10|nr:MFS transporter [Ammoniphilus sp. YIM 78166]